MLLRISKGAGLGFTLSQFSYLRLAGSLYKLNFVEGMANRSYESAVTALNGLQSNAAYLQKARTERNKKADKNIKDTIKHLQKLQITIQELESLNVIHVAGTKGKGSTCAFTESILRNHGYKTGFYSSPHLISVNERIRLNGSPILKDKFATYFWEVYNSIKLSLKEDEIMPSYFLFLTVMAFYVFIKEKVEAAIIEVGIGGLYDCTNIVKKPIVVGISTLGIDHVNILGKTITEIAEQKAGILKPGVPAFTVPQSENAMNVLRNKAQSVKCSLALSPPLETYENKIYLGVQGFVQNINASLALQLCHCWLNSVKFTSPTSSNTYNKSQENSLLNDDIHIPLSIANTFPIDLKTQNGLETCVWPGRFQTINKNKTTFYLDGAHTSQSMKYCGKWYEDLSQKHASQYMSPVLKVLLFNCTGERKAETLLDPLLNINFDIIMFCPNNISVIKDASSDLSNFMVEPGQEIQQCIINKEVWCHLNRSMYENTVSMASNKIHPTTSSYCDNGCDNAIIFASISDALNFINSGYIQNSDCHHSKRNELSELVKQASHTQILVTGSLHLVGGMLSLL